MRSRLAGAASVIVPVLTIMAQARACTIRLPSGGKEPLPVTEPDRAAQLLALRDIGSSLQFTGKPVLSVSPDGSRIAFQLRQADPKENGYCFAMVVIATSGPPAPRIVDTGGELMRFTFPELVGKANVPSGFPMVVSPQWFPDGQSVAFLKRVGGRTQIWRAYLDGRQTVPLFRAPNDLEDFRLLPGGMTIVASTRPSLRLALAAIADEGRRGYHYDDRFFPIASAAPFPKPPLPKSYVAFDLATGEERAATANEIAALAAPATGPGAPPSPQPGILSPRFAWTEEVPHSGFPAERRLAVQFGDGSIAACEAPACQGIFGAPWWSDTGTLFYLRREGWAKSITVLYEWRPREASPRQIYATEDIVFDCQPLETDIVCLREGSLDPRYIVRINPRSAEARVLFDPNSDFRPNDRGQVRRLKLKTRFGVEYFADLTYPEGYVDGRSYPLIVVQYNARGFLRGSTGDEFPIQSFAQHGFAVLTLERPASPVTTKDAKSFVDLDRADFKGFRDRRNVLSALETAVRHLIREGLVDRRRIGITGMSDGATTVQFAALHSKLFSVAAMGGCCWERGHASLLGPAVARQYREIGWSAAADDGRQIWPKISWVQNVGKVRFPVLMQLADSEYRSSLEAYTALTERGSTVDMFVFPDETHVKWQPQHKLALYQRYVAWFAFWLEGEEMPIPWLSSDLARWKEMRAAPRHRGW